MRKFKRNLSLVLALVLALSLAVPAMAVKAPGVKSEDYFDDYAKAEAFIKDTYGSVADDMIAGLKAVTDLGILVGSADGDKININAENGLTRLEYVALLYRLTQTTPIENTIYAKSESVFTDITNDTWGAKYKEARGYANWAYLNGVSSGISASPLLFGPANKMNYYDAMLMILSLLGVEKNVELGISEKVPSVPNNIRFMTTLQIANEPQFNLVRSINIQNTDQINRAEAINLMYYALSAKYVKEPYDKKGGFKGNEGATVFASAPHNGLEGVEGYISATKWADIDGDNAVKDGYVAVINIGGTHYQVDETVAALLGLKLNGFDNLMNLGEIYKASLKTAKKSDGTAYIANIISSSKVSSSKATAGWSSIGKLDDLKSYTGNNDIKDPTGTDISVIYDFNKAVIAKPAFGSDGLTGNGNAAGGNATTAGLSNNDGAFTKIIWKGNDVVRLFKSSGLQYEVLGKANDDGEFALNANRGSANKGYKTGNILGYDEAKHVEGAHVMTWEVGGNIAIFYLDAPKAGTATEQKADAEYTLVVSGSSYRVAQYTAINYPTEMTGFEATEYANVKTILGASKNFYYFNFMGANFVLSFSVDVATTSYIPKDYGVITYSYFQSAQPEIPGVRDAIAAIAVVTLYNEKGESKNYNLAGIVSGGRADGVNWTVGGTALVNGSGSDKFGNSSAGLTYKGSGAAAYPTDATSINNKPFAYAIDGNNVMLYEIPTLQVVTGVKADGSQGSSAISGGAFTAVMAPLGLNSKMLTDQTAVFLNDKAGANLSVVNKGAANISGTVDSSTEYTVYALNTNMQGAYSAGGTYNRLAVLFATSGAEANLLRNIGSADYFYTLSAPTYLADGKARQSVLNKNGEKVDLTTAKDMRDVMLTNANGAGYYVQYTFNTSGEVNGVRTFVAGPKKVFDDFQMYEDWDENGVFDLGVMNWSNAGSTSQRGWELKPVIGKLEGATHLVLWFEKPFNEDDLELLFNSDGTGWKTMTISIKTGENNFCAIDLTDESVTHTDGNGVVTTLPEMFAKYLTSTAYAQFGLTRYNAGGGDVPGMGIIRAFLVNNEDAIRGYTEADYNGVEDNVVTSFSMAAAPTGFDYQGWFLADGLSYIGTPGITNNGAEYVYNSDLSIYLINGSNGSKISLTDFAALNGSKGDYNMYFCLSSGTPRKINTIYVVKK